MATSLILAVGLFVPPGITPGIATAPAPAAAASTPIPGPDAVDVLGQWLKLYHLGQLDLTGSRQRLRGRGATMRAKDFVSITSGLFPDQSPEQWTHEQELERICEAVAGLKTAAAARALLEVAAVGLDQREYAPAMNPVVVRLIGEKQLAKLPPGECRDCLRDTAGGSGPVPLRAAALRALGALRDEAWRPALEAGLGDRTARIRLAAAQGLARSELKTAVPALADQVLREAEAAVRIAIVDALSAIATMHGAAIDERDRRRAVTSVLDGLGRHGWSADLAALDFLQKSRSADTVPALIALLEKYAGDADLRKDADRSGLVPFRAHELLVSLTGAVFPADQPAQWQKWWSEVKDTFVPAEPKAVARQPADAHGTVSNAFFGVPVRGSRVLFVVDVSGSMLEEWGNREAKIAVARRELRQAVERMAADCAFNLIVFSERAESWKENLTTATKANKESFYKYVDELQTRQATNVWAGLELALKLKSIEPNARYATPADEVFVLSDGLPTAGEILRPEQILATITETNRLSRVRINTVYIEGRRDDGGGRGGGGRGGGRGGRGGGGRGGGEGMTGAELMRKLAEQNGGVFLQPEPPPRERSR